MKTIVVLLKQTFDTEEKITIGPYGVEERGARLVINPYDEYALEEALQWREKLGWRVVAVTCGAEKAEEALRTALALGADEAIRLEDNGIASDSFAIAAALAAVIAPLKPELLLAGLFATDTGSGSVALQIAERLGLPHASGAIRLELLQQDDTATFLALVERDVEGDVEKASLPLPALITAQQGLNEPRYPSLPGIMKAKRKPINILSAQHMASPELAAEPRTIQAAIFPPPARSPGTLLTGTPAQQAAELAGLLRNGLPGS